MRRRGLWMGVVLVAAIAAVVAILRSGETAAPLPPAPPQQEQQPADTDPATDSTAESPAIEQAPVARREPVVERTPPPQRRAAQGFRGRVVDERQLPLAGVRVYLLESALNEPLSVPLLRRQGIPVGQVAETRSLANGAFELGLHLATEKLYEIRLLSPQHADLRVGDLRVLPREWHNLGALVMVPGTTVRGQVTVEGTSTPIPGATIAVLAGSVFEDASLQGIPDRENGLATRAGADGSYVIENAPARGVVRLHAFAPGFARVVRADVDLSAADEVEVHFGLPPGLELAGRVVDTADRPVRDARLEAWPKKTGTDPCIAQSDADGAFTIFGLRAEAYRLRVVARGHLTADLDDIAPGQSDLVVRLEPRSTLTLRVRTPQGRVLRDYRVGLRWWLSGGEGGQDTIGRVVDVPDRHVRLDSATDAFELPNVPVGEFVVQVTADDWAKTLSAPFEAPPKTGPLEVEVVVVPGATLEGIVVDERQEPLAGATVTTQVDGARPDNPIYRMLERAAPDRITAISATTGPDGRFVLPKLAYGTYQLEISHPEACLRYLQGIAVTSSERRDLGAIRLEAGALVFGRATADGRVAGQVKVVLMSVVAADAPPAEAAAAVRLETVTDSAGAFTLPRRIPPGEYELRAATVDAADSTTQIFASMLQMQRSARRFTVLPGQRLVEQFLDIPPQD